MANPFYVQPAQYGQALGGMAQSVQQFGVQQREQAEQQRLRERQEAARARLAEAAKSGDAFAMRDAVAEYPEIAEAMQQTFKFTNQATQQITKQGLRRFFSTDNPEERQAILLGTADAIKEGGGNPIITMRDAERYADPEQRPLVERQIKMAMTGIDPEGFEMLFGGKGQSDFIKDMIATGIDPKSERGQQLLQEKYGKGGVIAFDIEPVVNPATGKVELARIDKTQQRPVEFLGVAPKPEKVDLGDRVKTGGVQTIEDARSVISDANSTQSKAGGYAMRLSEADRSMTELENSGEVDFTSRALSAAMSPAGGFVEGVTDEFARRMLSPEEQTYVNQAQEFVRAALRQESGAVIGADEATEEIRKYFPRPGDSESVIESKRELRQRKIEELAAQSGNVFDAMRLLQSEKRGQRPPQGRQQQTGQQEQDQDLDTLLNKYAPEG